jgi:hypothetical protein
MNKFKYIIFIILGILLFLLLNTTDTFSIGNQYKLDRIYTDHNDPTSITDIDPNVVLKTMFDIIVLNQDICILNEFGQCKITLNESGGSCQLNTLLGLYQTALGVGFSPEDQYYINSQGIHLKNISNIKRTYDYLTNRQTMKPLLHHNGINSNVPIMTNKLNIIELKLDHLYPTYIGFDGGTPIRIGRSFFGGAPEYKKTPIFFQQDGETEYKFGHNLLMYKTNFAGLSSFLDYLEGEGTNLMSPLYVDLLAKKTQLETLDNVNIRNKSIVCIMIDFCASTFKGQEFFNAVTEFSNPSTLDLFDDDGNISDIQKYNDLWRVKLVGRWTKHFRGRNPKPIIRFLNFNHPKINMEFNLGDLTPDNLLLSPTDDPRKFIDSFLFFSYLHQDKDYDADGSEPVIKNRENFLGFPNTKCKESQEEPLCRDPDYYCHKNFSVNDSQYDVCKQPGKLNTLCKPLENLTPPQTQSFWLRCANCVSKPPEPTFTEPYCDSDDLYCDDGICKKLDTSCAASGAAVPLISFNSNDSELNDNQISLLSEFEFNGNFERPYINDLTTPEQLGRFIQNGFDPNWIQTAGGRPGVSGGDPRRRGDPSGGGDGGRGRGGRGGGDGGAAVPLISFNSTMDDLTIRQAHYLELLDFNGNFRHPTTRILMPINITNLIDLGFDPEWVNSIQ